MSGAGVVVTQLIVDASGSKQGVADFTASMEKAKASAITNGNATASSFEQAQKRWQKSLADTDPVIKAQIKMEQALAAQRGISKRALELGIGTEAAHAAQLERVRKIQQGYVDDAMRASTATTAFGRASSFAVAQLGPLMGLMSVATVVGFATSIFGAASSLDEMAQQAGVGVEALQAYRAAMLQSGIETGQADQIIARLTRTIGTAMEGGGKARDAFVQLGISVETLRGGAEATLPAVARGLLQIEDATERARLEVDLFGKTGQKLESALKALVDPTATLIEKQRALGQVLSEDVTTAADQAADKMTEAWNRAKNAVAPIIVSLVGGFLELMDVMGKVPVFDPLGVKKLEDAARAKLAKQRVDAAMMEANTPQYVKDAQATGFGFFAPMPKAPGTTTPAAKNFSDGEFQKAMAGLREEAELTTKTAEQRAVIVKLRELDAAKMKEGNGHLTEAEKLEISRLAVVQTRHDAGVKAAKAAEDARKKERDELKKFADEQDKFEEDEQKAREKKADDLAKLHQQQSDYLQDLRDDVQLAGMSREEAEKKSAVMRGIRDLQIEAGSAQAQEIEHLVEARIQTEKWRDVVDEMTGGFERFFEDIFTKGLQSFGDLWDGIKSMFIRMLAQMASQALIQPIIIPMVGEMFGMAGGIGMFGGGGGGMGGALSMLSGGSSLASSAGLFGSSGGGLSSIFGGAGGGNFLGLGAGAGGMFGGQGLINGLGGMLGFATPSAIPAAAGLSGAMGGISTSSIPLSMGAKAGSLFGSMGLGSFLGGVGIGSMAGSLAFGNKNDAGMGSMAGAALGQLLIPIPGVGAIIGGLVGGGLGSMTGSSNKGGISNFTNGGLGNTLFKAGDGKNGDASQMATGTVAEIIRQLKDAGVNVGLNGITGVSIGNDKSYVYDSAGGKQKLAGGDVEGIVQAVLNRILPTAAGTDEITNDIVSRYQANGGINSGNITELAREIEQARKVKDDAARVADEFQQAVTDFGPAIDAALKAINDPIGAQYDQIIAAQKARADEAVRLGVDVSRLTALNDAEIGQFLKGLTMEQLSGLSGTVGAAGGMAASMKAQLDAQAAEEMRGRLDAFSSETETRLNELLNPVGAQYAALIASQRDRQDIARGVGYDTSRLSALDAAELNQFLGGLSLADLQKLSTFVSAAGPFANTLMEQAAAAQAAADAAAKAAQDAVELAMGFENLSDSMSDLNELAQDSARAAQQAAGSWLNAREALQEASRALNYSDPALSPLERYNNSRSELDRLRGLAQGGSPEAASQFASFMGQFLQSSLAYNGATEAYISDRSSGQASLDALANFSEGQRSLAQQQADSLVQAVARLAEINDSVRQGDSKTQELLDGMTAAVEELAANVKQANLIAAHK